MAKAVVRSLQILGHKTGKAIHPLLRLKGTCARLVAPLPLGQRVSGHVAPAGDGAVHHQALAQIVDVLSDLEGSGIVLCRNDASLAPGAIGRQFQCSQVGQSLEIGLYLHSRLVFIKIQVDLAAQVGGISIVFFKGSVGDAVPGPHLLMPEAREALRAVSRQRNCRGMITRPHASVQPNGFVDGKKSQLLQALVIPAAVLTQG